MQYQLEVDSDSISIWNWLRMQLGLETQLGLGFDSVTALTFLETRGTHPRCQIDDANVAGRVYRQARVVSY
jgi:hypothetical protein